MTPSLLDASGAPMKAALAPASPLRHDSLSAWSARRKAPDWANLSRPRDAARAREMVETDGYAAGAVTKQVDSIVGSRLRLKFKPDARALGLDAAEIRDFIDQVQALFDAWCNDPRFYCDETRQTTLGGLFALAFRHYLVEGDAIGVIGFDPDRPFSTTVRIVDPDLLSNPRDAQDRPNLRGGVELDDSGVAVAYHFRGAHDASIYADRRSREWTEIAREDSDGCPIVVHFFDRHRDGQTRGRSNFDAIIKALKMEDKHAEVELEAAVLDAIMAPQVRTSSDVESLSEFFGDGGAQEYLTQRGQYYEAAPVQIDGVRVNHLMPGDEMTVADSRRPSQGYAEFSSSVLRRIAAGLGITYEQMAQDWSKVNYSSARAALNEIWRSWTQRRFDFVQRFCAPVFAAWFEEALARGIVTLPAGAPGLHDAYGAWCRVTGIGPGKGFVDPVKEVQAARLRLESGFDTLENITEDLTGVDHRDIFAQLARERDEAPKGYAHPAFSTAPSTVIDPDEDDPDDEDRKQREQAA